LKYQTVGLGRKNRQPVYDLQQCYRTWSHPQNNVNISLGLSYKYCMS